MVTVGLTCLCQQGRALPRLCLCRSVPVSALAGTKVYGYGNVQLQTVTTLTYQGITLIHTSPFSGKGDIW